MKKETNGEMVLYDSTPSMFRNRPFLFLLSIIVPVIGWIVLLFWWLKVVNTKLTVTNERVTFRAGIFSKSIREIYLSDIRSVQINQQFLQRIFGTGTIEISSAATSEAEIKIDGIPAAYQVKRFIDEYRRTH